MPWALLAPIRNDTGFGPKREVPGNWMGSLPIHHVHVSGTESVGLVRACGVDSQGQLLSQV